MRREEQRWFSGNLGHDMDVIVYGHAGKPLVCFPSKEGRTRDWESFGMVDCVADMLEQGKLMMFAVDGIDWQSWTNHSIGPADRARRHDDYDRYLAGEVVPFVRDLTGWDRAWATGASMGGYHAANVVFRHPDLFDGLIALSGLYQLGLFVGDDQSEGVYLNSPLRYLPNLEDPWYLARLREAKLAIVVGRGAWEDDMLADTRALSGVLAAKGIPAIVDEWGDDVNHDWPWWRKMLPHYLERLGV